MAGSAETMSKAIDALVEGKDLEQAVYGDEQETVEATTTHSDEGPEEKDSSLLDEMVGEEQQEQEEPVEEKQAEPVAEDSEFEVIQAGGRKIRVDYKDREKIKKAHQMAAGMRQFQKERDDVVKEMSSVKTQLDELKGLWGKVEGAAKRNDHNELFKIMTGGQMDLNDFVASKLEREKLRETATDEEIERMDLTDKVNDLETRLAARESELEEKLGLVEKRSEEAEFKRLEATISPVFNEVRFHGKLGDADTEAKLDKLLWVNLLDELEKYDEVTPDVVQQEANSISKLLQNHINKQAETKTTKTLKNKKKLAKETASLQQKRGYANSQLKDEFSKLVNDGDVTTLLTSWDKFGKLFG